MLKVCKGGGTFKKEKNPVKPLDQIFIFLVTNELQ